MGAGEIIPVGDFVALDVILMEKRKLRDWLIYKIYFSVPKSMFLCVGFVFKKSYIIASGSKVRPNGDASSKKGSIRKHKRSKNVETQCMRKLAE